MFLLISCLIFLGVYLYKNDGINSDYKNLAFGIDIVILVVYVLFSCIAG